MSQFEEVETNLNQLFGQEFIVAIPNSESVLSTETFTSQSGKVYTVTQTDEIDLYETPKPFEEIFASFDTSLAPPSDDFAGTARKAAKISVADAEMETFDDMKDLVESLVADETMINRQPKISRSADSDRVSEEERNVEVFAFLYAASREKDNDYHLIIGRDPDEAEKIFMTMEISGLPPVTSDSFEQIKSARDSYKGFFPKLPGFSYFFYDPPIPIKVGGSLFFDMSHSSGSKPGPSKLRPFIPTIWEIHPITEIIFEP